MADLASLAWLAIPIGLALIGMGLADVGLTVLHIQAESPISNKINRTVWRALSVISRPMGSQVQDRVLAWGLPLMTAITLGFWVVCYVLGFGFLYLPLMERQDWFSGNAVAGTGALDAFYFSAVSFLTIGFGDLVPVHPWVRFLSVLEGALGLFTISLSVTYLLSVYPLVTRKMAFAAALNQETAGRPDGVAVFRRYIVSGRFRELGDRLRVINDELLLLGQAHATFPLLFYVRPGETHESFARVLVLVQGIVSTLKYTLDRQAHPEVVTDPHLAALEEGLLYTLHTLDKSEHLRSHEAIVNHSRIEEELASSVANLRALGATTVSFGDERRLARVLRFREATDPYITAYAGNLKYLPSEVRATVSRWARDTALEERPDDK
jgi:hypothetical protein